MEKSFCNNIILISIIRIYFFFYGLGCPFDGIITIKVFTKLLESKINSLQLGILLGIGAR